MMKIGIIIDRTGVREANILAGTQEERRFAFTIYDGIAEDLSAISRKVQTIASSDIWKPTSSGASTLPEDLED